VTSHTPTRRHLWRANKRKSLKGGLVGTHVSLNQVLPRPKLQGEAPKTGGCELVKRFLHYQDRDFTIEGPKGLQTFQGVRTKDRVGENCRES